MTLSLQHQQSTNQELELNDYFSHRTAIIDSGAVVGKGTRIWHWTHVSGSAIIGEQCNIGQNVFIADEVVIGKGCKIQNNVSVYQGVTLEDYVFCGPSMVFTNIYNPRSEIRKMDQARPTLIKRGASLGANCTIVCGNTIGSYAFIGAGSLVNRDVPDHALMVGNPARQIGWMCNCGERLSQKLECTVCAAQYQENQPHGLKIKVASQQSPPKKQNSESNIQNSIPFIDLAAQQKKIRSGIDQRIRRVLDHGQYIMGPEIFELEYLLADYVGAAHCITCASGTDALLISLMALDIQPGDEVITVPYTWISTAEVVALLQALPVFVDILADTFNMDPDRLESAITPRTRAIIPVGIYGQCADMTCINAIAEKHGIPVIEDAAQCFGATHHGLKSCNLSLIGCTSFFPSKPLGCYGDGGAIFTSDSVLADKMRQIRIHGQKVKHQHPLVGINGRLDTLQAAILLEKFILFPNECVDRNTIAARYDSMLTDISDITIPQIATGNTSVYAQYTVLIENRDTISNILKSQGIPTASYYTVPLHLQSAFADLGYKAGAFPVSEKVAAQCLSLPMSPYLSPLVQQKISSTLKAYSIQ
jgi:dTDP-4-amino-4,6-dideoxygalactose transaminase/acetyltransferase-like isoleucine patch superfamily enzyme